MLQSVPQSDRELLDRELMRAHVYVRDARDFVTTGDEVEAQKAARSAAAALKCVIDKLVDISVRRTAP